MVKKQLLGMAAGLTMLFLPAVAADAADAKENGIYLGSSVLYENGVEKGALPGAKYDPATSTLTLNGCYIDNSSQWYGLYIKGMEDITINLIGDNVISVKGEAGEEVMGICMDGTDANGGRLTISGEGSLTVTVNEQGRAINIGQYDDFVMESGTLNLAGGEDIGMFFGMSRDVGSAEGDGDHTMSFLGGEVNISCPDFGETYEVNGQKRGTQTGGIYAGYGNIVIKNTVMDIDLGHAFLTDGGILAGGYHVDGDVMKRQGGLLEIENSTVTSRVDAESSPYNNIFCLQLEDFGNGVWRTEEGGPERSAEEAVVRNDLEGMITYTCESPYVSVSPKTEKKPLPFGDVKQGDWYYDYVDYVYQNSLMTGLSDTVFGPADDLARAQFAVILWRMNGSPEAGYQAIFPDVADELWYTDAILWANGAGVVKGYDINGYFGPSDKITREQMAVMMYRYAQYKNYDVSQKADFSKFADAANVSDFAKEAMQWAVGTGIISGKYNETVIDPQGNANRAECATIIMRFMELYK